MLGFFHCSGSTDEDCTGGLQFGKLSHVGNEGMDFQSSCGAAIGRFMVPGP